MVTVATADKPANTPPMGPPALPSLQQIVKTFDFEESDVAPNSMPTPFFRSVAPKDGFPPFGAMRLTTAVAHSGASSFEFELGGGSMSARIPTSIVPVLPLTSYAISVAVRTDGLQHARARLVALLYDRNGQPIAESKTQSRAIETAGQWETINIEIAGRHADAADLVIELQVLQPSQLNFGALAIAPEQPRLEDISGRAWFDDIVVSHLPNVSLTLKHPGNLVPRSQSPDFQILVNELTSEPLTARLQVFDLNGTSVFDSTFPAPRGRAPGSIRVPINTCGWYRALLHVSSDGGVSRWQWLDFAVLSNPRLSPERSHRLGVALQLDSFTENPNLADVVSSLGVGTVVVPVWDGADSTHQSQRSAALHQLIEQLLRHDQDLIFSLQVVPDELARVAGVDRHQVLELLAKDSHLWQPYLDELLVNFGLEVSRWQIGDFNDAQAHATASQHGLRPLTELARNSLADFVPKPLLYTAWPIDQAISPEDQLSGYAVKLPHELQPSALEDYAASLLANNSDAFATLEVLPEQSHTPRQRVSDLMIRGLYAWRSGLPLINIAAPWSTDQLHHGQIMPEPTFGAWRTLSEQLQGKVFAGEIPLADGQHCWLLRSEKPDQSAMVAWSDRVPFSNNNTAQPTDTFTLQLAAGAVTLIDAYGNTSTVQPTDGVHTIPLTDIPVFIEHGNLNLVQFRGNITIEPDFIPATAKVHEHSIVLRNPWKIAVSGTIRLAEVDEWKLSPSVQEFTIRPGGEVHLPLNIIPQRSILAGPKLVRAQITLNADQAYLINLELPLEVGLKNIDLAPSWSVSRNPITGLNDLVITQAVTNHGEKTVRLNVFIMAEGVGQNRRTIAALAPGETQVRSFRIPNGAARLSGQQVRIGVSERDGLTRLNQLLAITSQPAEPATRSADASSP